MDERNEEGERFAGTCSCHTDEIAWGVGEEKRNGEALDWSGEFVTLESKGAEEGWV